MKKLLFCICFTLMVTNAYAAPKIEYIYSKPGDSLQSYADAKVQLKTGFNRFSFLLRLTNQTDSPIVIDWNNVSIIDTTGVARRVCLGENTYITRNNVLPPTQVPPQATIEKVLFPLEFIRGIHDYIPLVDFPVKMVPFQGQQLDRNTKTAVYKKFMANYDKKKLGLYLPLVFVDGVENYTIQYQFDFSAAREAASVSKNAKTQTKETPNLGLIFSGTEVKEVKPDSLADKAGLRKGDTILEVNGRPADSKNLQDIETRLSSGRTVMLVYERDSKKDMVTLKP